MSPRNRRVRPLLLLLLWIWAGCVFLIVDLFFNVEEFDEIRPRSDLYRGMRVAAHKMVGERTLDSDFENQDSEPETRSATGEVHETSPTVLIRGRVYRPDAAPAAGAVVAARDVATADVVRGRVEQDGAFALPVPPGRSYLVAAAAAGVTAAVPHRVHPPARVHLVLPEAARIAGRAVDESERGVEGVSLRLDIGRDMSGDPMRAGPQSRWILAELGGRNAKTGRDGVFSFEGVLRGAYRIVVADGPVRVGDGTRVHVPGPGTVECQVQVHPAPPVLVTGVVRGADDGQPLGGAEVDFTPGGVVQTNDEGAFRIEAVPQGRVRVDVRAPGRPPLTQGVAIDAAPEPLELSVPAARVVAGRVLGPDGAPFTGARVSWTGLPGPEPDQVTDDDGRFRFAPVAPRAWGMVTVKAAGCATLRKQVRPGTADLAVQLEKGARIEGRVAGAGEGVLVRLVPALRLRNARGKRMDVREAQVTRTDAEGRYAFDGLPAGMTTVIAMPEGAAPAAVSVAASAGAVVEAPELHPGAGAMLEGVVVDTDGQPVAGALVIVSSLVSSSVAVTDTQGHFALAGRPQEIDEAVRVTRDGYWPGRTFRRAPTTAPLEIRLRSYR